VSFPRYPTYKKSKSGWMFDVPGHWELLPCRGFVEERTEKNADASCQSYLSLMANVGVIPYEEKGDIGNKRPDDLSKCKVVHKGDFVINSMNYGIGSYGVSSYEGVCSPVYIILRPKSEVIEPSFAFRVFEDKSFQAYAQSFGNGILAHRCSIGWDDLKGIAVGIPPAEEQKSIINFLDNETAKIDSLISKQEQLIELLQEKRQAVISHAVTKGLNPNAPMKVSGVEWLGEVPEHWEEARVKQFFRPKKDQGHPDLEVLSVYRDHGVVPKNSRNDNFNKTPEDLSKYQLVEIDDLVINKMKCWQGSLGISQLRGITSPDYIVLSSRHSQNSKFLHWLLRSKTYSSTYRAISNGIRPSQWRVESERFLCLPVFVPPLEEQSSISEYISVRNENFNNLTELAETQISLLRERRSALISAAVTGQIDVRDLGSGQEVAT